MAEKGDASKISVQFGSITPGVVNGMQVLARTSSAPPNLDEQRRDQVGHDSMKSNPPVTLPVAPKQQLRKNMGVVDKSMEKEDRAASKGMKDQVVPTASATLSQKPSVHPTPGKSMPMHFHQLSVPLQFSGPNQQIQSQGPAATPIQFPIPLPMPITVATSPHGVQQFGRLRKAAVKITHPETHQGPKFDTSLKQKPVTEACSAVSILGKTKEVDPASGAVSISSDSPAIRAMSADKGPAQLLSNAFTDAGGRRDYLMLSNLKDGKIIRNPPESKNNVGCMGPLQTAGLKENSALDTVKAKSFASKRKKKRKEILPKADAAGATSYLAYKGPEDGKGIAASQDREIATPYNNPKHLSAEGCGEASVVSEDSDRSKTEPDDWDNVADISTAELTDDDRWNKLPGPIGAGQNMRLDVGFGMNMGFRPGHGGNIGVLRNPRTQAPVPCISGLLSGLMQSLGSQGGLVRNSPDTDWWKRAACFQQKGLFPSPHSPLQAMHKAEKKYEVGKVTDEEEAKQRQLKAILNNFEKLFEQVRAVKIDNAITLTGLVSLIFDKALMKPTFCEMYADLCCHLAQELPDFSDGNEKITFKRLLLNKCQEEFERGEREREEADSVHEEGEVKLSEERREEKRIKARRRMLGNIRLIGELYKKRMLTEKIMHECIKKLLGQHQTPHEEDIEALCKLMSTIGEMIDHPKARDHIDVYFERMEILSNNMSLSSRVRFMLKDAIELRKIKWQQRRKVTHGLSSVENAGHGSRADTTTLTERFPGRPSYNQYSMPDPNNSSAFATSPSSPGQDRDFSSDVPSEKKWPEEKLRNMSIAAIREFYSAKDENEVALCIKDLKSASFYPSMVSLWVTDSFERKAVERDLLANLLVNLTRPQDGMLSQVQLIKGFESVLHCLEDVAIDAPKAPKFLGRIFGKVVSENRVSLKEIGQIILEGGEEPGGLLEAGLAAIVLESTLEMIESLKGESVLDDVWMSSNLRSEDFRPFDPIKSSLLGRFMWG